MLGKEIKGKRQAEAKHVWVTTDAILWQRTLRPGAHMRDGWAKIVAIGLWSGDSP